MTQTNNAATRRLPNRTDGEQVQSVCGAVFPAPHFRSNPFGIIRLLRSKMMQPIAPARCAETHTSPSLTTRNVRRLEVGRPVLVARPEAAWPR
jgi:hypothetical protein